MNAAKPRQKLTLDVRLDIIKQRAGVTDATRILHRLAALLEDGEPSESVLQRLNPPARKPEKPTGWFVGDS